MASRVRVFVLEGGKLQIFVDEGTDEEAVAITKQVLATMQASGIPFVDIGDIEFHRTGGEHVHVRSEVHLDH